MGSHSVTCHPAVVRIPPLPPAIAGTRFSDLGGMQGWVDLLCERKRLEFKPTTCQSQVQQPKSINESQNITALEPYRGLPVVKPTVSKALKKTQKHRFQTRKYPIGPRCHWFTKWLLQQRTFQSLLWLLHTSTPNVTLLWFLKVQFYDTKRDRNRGGMQTYQSETLQNDKVIDKDETKCHAQPRTVGQTLGGINACQQQHTPQLNRREEAGTHKSVKTHVGTVLLCSLSHDVKLWSLDTNKKVSRTRNGKFLCQFWWS